MDVTVKANENDRAQTGITISWNANLPQEYNVKHYLEKEELDKLNDLTNLFLDIAEIEAKEQKTMMMSDWIEVADDLLKYRKKKILNGSGIISHKQAIEKAENEYEKFRIKQDREYISSMDEMYKKYLEEI